MESVDAGAGLVRAVPVDKCGTQMIVDVKSTHVPWNVTLLGSRAQLDAVVSVPIFSVLDLLIF